MAKLHEVSPHIHWAFEQLKEKYPNTTFKIRWDPMAEGFVIATNDADIDDSKEFIHFSYNLKEKIFAHCPYLLYTVYDSALSSPDYYTDDYDIDTEYYNRGYAGYDKSMGLPLPAMPNLQP